MDAWLEEMMDGRKETTARKNEKEAYLEKIEANPEDSKSIAQQQEVPKEGAAVETIIALGDRHLAIGRRRQPNNRTQGDGGSWQKLVTAQGRLLAVPFLHRTSEPVVKDQAGTVLQE
jgi:hypothetical protein